MNKYLFLTIVTFLSEFAFAQRYDTLVRVDSVRNVPMQVYPVNGQLLIYPRPKPFSFVTQLPKTFAGAAKISFRRESLKGWAILATTTAALILIDQEFADRVQAGSAKIGLSNDRIFIDVLKIKLGKKEFDIYQAPGNFNTAVYTIGEGVPPLLLGAGLYGYGLIKKDYRAISTASQIVQATTAAGVMTQFFKRTTGRQSPFASTQPGGRWRPFPHPKTYQQHVPEYDAFPSGHMGTLMCTYVVITENYPEKRWIKPVGISIMALVGLSMVNNGVHWTSDYPLAIGMGYAFGKATVKLNRLVKGLPLKPQKKR